MMTKSEIPTTPHPPIWIETKQGRVMTFKTPYFDLAGNHYKLIAMDKRDGDYWHSVINLATREIREVRHQELVLWFTREVGA